MTNIERNRQIASEIVARHNQRKAELTEQGIDTTITITSEDIKQIKARAKEQVIDTNTMKTTNQTSAIDKMRSIVNWANYQSEGVNQNIRSIKDLVKVYDFCNSKGIEFADTLQTEEPRLYEQITNKLGYKF